MVFSVLVIIVYLLATMENENLAGVTLHLSHSLFVSPASEYSYVITLAK